ncbi:YciI family protein [Streptomyces sp. NPDC091219]|uniref:YciI family protein n=1 Tax=Streptomyces sp. NPDC091219 TaxID=3155193 RepID=UPI00344F7578
MPAFTVLYDYFEQPDELNRVRPDHRAFIIPLCDDGIVLAAGPFGPGEPPGGLIIVEASDAEQVKELFDKDPFWVAGLVKARRIRAWNPVIGQVGPQENGLSRRQEAVS